MRKVLDGRSLWLSTRKRLDRVIPGYSCSVDPCVENVLRDASDERDISDRVLNRNVRFSTHPVIVDFTRRLLKDGVRNA